MADKKAKILLVEDDLFMRRLYSEAFTLAGYTVTAAVDGGEGLMQIYKDIPSIVLLDVMMPEMNGIELLEKIKADPITKHIPVIMLTNLSGKTEENNALSKGAEKYLVKSEYEPKQVVQIVEEILSVHP